MPRPEVAFARKQRRQMSYPEVLLWQRLRGKAAGAKFRRQHPLGPYIVDFYCPTSRLAIEVDGEVHALTTVIAHDEMRDRFLIENSYRVIHINARDILADADGVAASIASLAALPLHHASHGSPPRAGEDQGKA
jgi:very-short-patch-repair endonuclease